MKRRPRRASSGPARVGLVRGRRLRPQLFQGGPVSVRSVLRGRNLYCPRPVRDRDHPVRQYIQTGRHCALAPHSPLIRPLGAAADLYARKQRARPSRAVWLRRLRGELSTGSGDSGPSRFSCSTGFFSRIPPRWKRRRATPRFLPDHPDRHSAERVLSASPRRQGPRPVCSLQMTEALSAENGAVASISRDRPSASRALSLSLNPPRT